MLPLEGLENTATSKLYMTNCAVFGTDRAQVGLALSKPLGIVRARGVEKFVSLLGADANGMNYNTRGGLFPFMDFHGEPCTETTQPTRNYMQPQPRNEKWIHT